MLRRVCPRAIILRRLKRNSSVGSFLKLKLRLPWSVAHFRIARQTGYKWWRRYQASGVGELIVRARSGFKSVYGPDSTQYQQAGGTRKSDRKRPVRRAQTELKSAA